MPILIILPFIIRQVYMGKDAHTLLLLHDRFFCYTSRKQGQNGH